MANEVRINVTSRDRSGPGFTSARRRADDLGNSTKRIGEIAAGVLASGVFERIAGAAVRAFTDTIRAASDLQQAVGGTEAVFGDASGAIDDFASRSANAAGLSQSAFREATTLIGGQLKRMTEDVGFASDASIQLVQVGADLAATYGGTTKEAVDAFAAALRGEADPAERFNLNLKISEQNAKAVELGLASSTSEVDDNARAQAILALVMEQSADAQGQFAREADTAAVAGQKFNATMEDTQAELGQAVLPVMSALANVATDVLAGFQALPGPVQVTVAAIAALGLTAGVAATAMRAFGISIATVKAALGPIGIALAVGGAIIGGLAALGSNSQESSGNVDQLTQSLERGTGAITNMTREQVLLDLQQRGAAESARELGIATEDLVAAWLGEDEALARVNEQLNALIEAGTTSTAQVISHKEGLTEQVEVLDETAQAALALKEEIAAGNITTEEAAERAAELTEVQKAEAGAFDETTGEINTQIESLKELAEEMGKSINPALGLIDAEQDLEDAQKAVTEAEDKHGKKSPEFREALRNETKAALDVLDAAGKVSASFTGKLSRAQRQVLQDAGVSEAAIEGLERDLRNAKESADNLDGTRVVVNEQHNVRTSFFERHVTTFEQRGVPFDPFAAGGIVGGEGLSTAQGGGPRGNRVLVGEQRPEVVELPVGSRVIPSVDQATDRGQLAGAGGGGPTVIEFHSDGTRMMELLMEVLRESIRVEGGNVQVVLGSG